jgi:putative hydrolase of HD superfamily
MSGAGGAGGVSRDVELLHEVGSLRRVARTWVQFTGAPMANVAEHTLRVAWIAMAIARREDADGARCAQLALIHDVAESRTGDVHYLSRMYVERREDEALRDVVAGTSLQDDVEALWAEYHAQASLEARVVKDADNLDCDLELTETPDAALIASLRPTRDRVREKLHTDTARALFDAIYADDPHAWHTTAPNRMVAGDWAGGGGDAGGASGG